MPPLPISPLLTGLPWDARRTRPRLDGTRRCRPRRLGNFWRRLGAAALGLQLEQLEYDDERLEKEVVPGDGAVAVDDGLERQVAPEGVQLLADSVLGVRRREQLQVEGVRLPVVEPRARRALGLQRARPVAPQHGGREEDVGAAAAVVRTRALQLAQKLGEQVEAGLGAPQRNLLLIHSTAALHRRLTASTVHYSPPPE